MKLLSIISLSIILLTACNHAKKSSSNSTNETISKSMELVTGSFTETTFTFDNFELGGVPSGWSQYATGVNDTTDWRIMDDGGNKVLAQLSEEKNEDHFNEIVYDGLKVKNVELNVRIKPLHGVTDQGGGFVWRFVDADNHYIVRENPLEDNVVLYKMENGERIDLPLVGKGRTYGVDVESLGQDWNSLRLTVVDDLFTVYLNGKQLFQVKDETFKNAGKVGLWTKSDAVTYFDDFQVLSLDQEK